MHPFRKLQSNKRTQNAFKRPKLTIVVYPVGFEHSHRGFLSHNLLRISLEHHLVQQSSQHFTPKSHFTRNLSTFISNRDIFLTGLRVAERPVTSTSSARGTYRCTVIKMSVPRNAQVGQPNKTGKND